MSNIYLKSGSLRIGASKIKLVPFDFDFYYSNDNKWLFNISGLDGKIANDLNTGYEIQVQLVRYQPKGNYNKYNTPNGYLSSSEKRIGKPSYPNFIGIKDIGTSTIVTADKKARINITNQQTNGFQNIDLTTWVNNMIKHEGLFKKTNLYLRQVQFTQLTEGYWFSNFRFIILINNKKYNLTNKLLRIEYYNNGNINQSNVSNVIQTSNLITVSVGL
jgi:hypothetical protein